MASDPLFRTNEQFKSPGQMGIRQASIPGPIYELLVHVDNVCQVKRIRIVSWFGGHYRNHQLIESSLKYIVKLEQD